MVDKFDDNASTTLFTNSQHSVPSTSAEKPKDNTSTKRSTTVAEHYKSLPQQRNSADDVIGGSDVLPLPLSSNAIKSTTEQIYHFPSIENNQIRSANEMNMPPVESTNSSDTLVSVVQLCVRAPEHERDMPQKAHANS